MASITDELRRALIESGAPTAELDGVLRAGGPVWDTKALQEDFTVHGFAAPFVVATRKADGVKGSLMFNHDPRLYFDWRADV
jgi:hypothetical protein